MPLIYAFVARRQTVLAEFTNYSGNFSTIATQVRASERASDARRVRGLERARARVALRFGLETNRDANSVDVAEYCACARVVEPHRCIG